MTVWREANEAWFRVWFAGIFPDDVAQDMMDVIMGIHRIEKIISCQGKLDN